jgi:hypothetical protein
VQLNDVVGHCSSERGRGRTLVGARSYNDVVGLEKLVAGLDEEALVRAPNPGHVHLLANGRADRRRVILQVRDHLGERGEPVGI